MRYISQLCFDDEFVCCNYFVWFFVTSCFLQVWHDSTAQAEIFVEMASLTWFFAMSFGSIEISWKRQTSTPTLFLWYEYHGHLLDIFQSYSLKRQTRSSHEVTIVEWGNIGMTYRPCIKSLHQVSRHRHEWSLKSSSASINVFSMQSS